MVSVASLSPFPSCCLPVDVEVGSLSHWEQSPSDIQRVVGDAGQRDHGALPGDTWDADQANDAAPMLEPWLDAQAASLHLSLLRCVLSLPLSLTEQRSQPCLLVALNARTAVKCLNCVLNDVSGLCMLTVKACGDSVGLKRPFP